ncbi:MAG: ATP-binding protein, partial [Bacteroidales bacterium]|nr:ATP-binding protein [Bacteroidales bacterium]
QDDILKIAKGQIKNEEILSLKANKMLICDTELLVTKIWIEHKYKKCHPWILETIKKHTYDLYLLCNIDLQWQPDPQREHPQLRDYFLNLFKNELINRKFNFDIVSGQSTERFKNAIRIIDKFIKNNNDFANTN